MMLLFIRLHSDTNYESESSDGDDDDDNDGGGGGDDISSVTTVGWCSC